MLGQLTDIRDSGDAQGAPEGPPTLCQREACRNWVQVSTPTRHSAGRIRPKDVTILTVDRDYAQKFLGRLTFPTAHTGALRPRVSCHEESLPLRARDRAARLRDVISAAPPTDGR